ncbi:MAG: hypothetical protein GY804_08870 [Alphaproteobacteria bacterium]|nr:hypothetical protein [Alphaproteobacteria bacterium]
MIIPNVGDVVEYCISASREYTEIAKVIDIEYHIDLYGLPRVLAQFKDKIDGLDIDFINCEHITRIVSHAPQHTPRKTNICRTSRLKAGKSFTDYRFDGAVICVINILTHMNVKIIKPINHNKVKKLYAKNGRGLRTDPVSFIDDGESRIIGFRISIKNKKKFKRWVATNYTRFYDNKAEWKKKLSETGGKMHRDLIEDIDTLDRFYDK